jgi:hypothetical protein
MFFPVLALFLEGLEKGTPLFVLELVDGVPENRDPPAPLRLTVMSYLLKSPIIPRMRSPSRRVKKRTSLSYINGIFVIQIQIFSKPNQISHGFPYSLILQRARQIGHACYGV